MIFHMPQKRMNHLHLNVENTAISEFNILGLTINEHVNCKILLDKLSNNISKSMSVLNKHFVPLNVRIIIYNSLILFHIN